MKGKRVLESIANYYGYEKQSSQLIEEMAELTQAICKYKRKYGDDYREGLNGSKERRNMIEEISDTLIMLEQIIYLLDIKESEVAYVMRVKIHRQLKRINDDMEQRKKVQYHGEN